MASASRSRCNTPTSTPKTSRRLSTTSTRSRAARTSRGFRTALTRTVNAYGKKAELFKDVTPSGEDIREGLTAVISVRVPEPKFESQTKVKLNNGEVESIVNSVVGEILGKFFEENPKVAKMIAQKGFSPPKRAKPPARPSNCSRDRKGVLSGGSLPGKLRDCTSRVVDAANCTSWKVTRPAVRPKADACRLFKRSSLCAVKSSTPTNRARTRSSTMPKSAA